MKHAKHVFLPHPSLIMSLPTHSLYHPNLVVVCQHLSPIWCFSGGVSVKDPPADTRRQKGWGSVFLPCLNPLFCRVEDTLAISWKELHFRFLTIAFIKSFSYSASHVLSSKPHLSQAMEEMGFTGWISQWLISEFLPSSVLVEMLTYCLNISDNMISGLEYNENCNLSGLLLNHLSYRQNKIFLLRERKLTLDKTIAYTDYSFWWFIKLLANFKYVWNNLCMNLCFQLCILWDKCIPWQFNIWIKICCKDKTYQMRRPSHK